MNALKLLTKKILTPFSKAGRLLFFEKIAAIEYLGYERVYDIEVENSHNFVGNRILAHNTFFGGTLTATTGNLVLQPGGTTSGLGGTANIVFQSATGTIRGRIDTAAYAGSNGYGTLYIGAVNTTNADVAEYYDALEPDLVPGTVVSFSTGLAKSGMAGLVKTASSSANTLAGVISTAPGLILGGFDSIDTVNDTTQKALLVLVGRTPVKVTTDNGPIAPGDKLTPSTITPGSAMKYSGSGPIIGTSLQFFGTASTAPISASTTPDVPLTSSSTDSILALVNVSTSGNLTAELGTMSNGALSADLDLGGHAITNVGSIAGANNLWSIDANGVITAQSVETQSLTVGSASTTVSGITLYDRGTGAPKCLYVGEYNDLRVADGACPENGVAAASSLVPTANASSNNTPVLSTTPDPNVTPAVISASSTSSNIEASSTATFTITATPTTVATTTILTTPTSTTTPTITTTPVITTTPTTTIQSTSTTTNSTTVTATTSDTLNSSTSSISTASTTPTPAPTPVINPVASTTTATSTP